MTEQVRDYVTRAMIGRRVEIVVYDDGTPVVTAYGRLMSMVSWAQGQQFYFEGDRDKCSVQITDGSPYMITYDPEERD